MRIFVAGGAGYIGGIVASHLLEQGNQVLVYDNLSRGNRQAIPAGAEFVMGDIQDSSLLDRHLQDGAFDAILHFAAFIEAGESMKTPGEFFENNVVGSIRLINAAVRNHIPRFVFSSSAGVYAESATPLEETSPIAPANVYGQTKKTIEELLDWQCRIHGLRFASLRYFNAAGATESRGEDHRPETHLIPLVLEVALDLREKISVFGADYPTPDGSCIRDYIHVLDLAEAHSLALAALEDRPALILNVGVGHGYSVMEVIKACQNVTGRQISFEICPRRPGDPASLVAANAKIKELLDWTPRFTSLESIIESAWRWRVDHPLGYAPVPSKKSPQCE